MAYTFDYATKIVSIPQADLTNITGTLYELDTNDFLQKLQAEQASEDGMPFITMFTHNTEVTVAGTTFARTIEVINSYQVEFLPDAQFSARLAGSNNNIFDVEGGILVQNQVQLISTNSGGLIVTEAGGGGPTASSIADAVWNEAKADHTTVDTFGGEATSASESADAVWDELKADHTTPATFGGEDSTLTEIVDGVWDEPMAAHTTPATFGDQVRAKLLTLGKWIGLR